MWPNLNFNFREKLKEGLKMTYSGVRFWLIILLMQLGTGNYEKNWR